MQLGKWANSLAVRLPGSLVQELGMAVGDEIELVPARKLFYGQALLLIAK